MVAIELEALAKKFDRFGWDRDRNTPAHDRQLMDWMDALQDYSLGEIQAACARQVIEYPNKMPNEGHILAQIMNSRSVALRLNPLPPAMPEQEAPPRQALSKARRQEIIAEVCGAAVPASLTNIWKGD